MDRPPITICTTTKNCADDLDRLLDSVIDFADEIVVVDSDSTDGTISVAENHGAEVYQRDFTGFAGIKRYAIQQATNDWVWILDADEEVSPDLRHEALSALSKADDTVAFKMRKRNLMFGEETNISHPKRPYLAKKEVLEFKNEIINETLQVKAEYRNRVKKLGSEITHHAYESIGEYLETWDRYSTLEAKQIRNQGNERPFLYYFIYGLGECVYYLFIEGAILDGWRGIFFALMSLNFRIAVYGKLRGDEILLGEKLRP
ncbi:Glycosyltransferase involved in cell wall bisynthesis [Halobellus clavatus]|uniref:Glycosyltransferase involved in cell wall bisynthesis n=2 Tax=Halobellus clavatus TaxID=660517 RepID=A0A1H3JZ63_9EURY|nr:Glycosyltransferase involved in cell wall bisynthesis [Halobellus clavatus]